MHQLGVRRTVGGSGSTCAVADGPGVQCLWVGRERRWGWGVRVLVLGGCTRGCMRGCVRGSGLPVPPLSSDARDAVISFDASPSLPYLLYNESNRDIFDSYNVCVYEEEKLIAVGYFDLGQTTSMGISCFYDPDYKKYSLGKYLMLLKIEYAIEQGLTYFYPGYFAPGYPLFDYKLDLAKAGLSFLDVVSNEWFDIAYFDSSQTPLVKMRQELNQLSTLLSNAGIDNSVWDYGYYDANLIPDLNGMGIFDFPVFLCCFDMLDSLMNPLVIYDPRDNNFHLILCRSLFRGDSSPHLEKKKYIANLLTIAKHYTATHSAEHLVNILLHSTKQSQKEQKS